jgi:hypothetical protein
MLRRTLSLCYGMLNIRFDTVPFCSFIESKRKGGSNAKPEKKDRNITNLKVVVGVVQIIMKLQNGCSLNIDISNVVMASTNQDWKVVDLAQASAMNPERTKEYLFKNIEAKSISIHLQEAGKRQAILQDLPITIHRVSCYTADDAMVLLSTRLEIVLEVGEID